MKDLDDLLGINFANAEERERQRDLRLRQHCLAVKRFQSGIDQNNIHPSYGEISKGADYVGDINVKSADGKELCLHFRAMKGISKDPFINSVGELHQTPWFVATLMPKSANGALLTDESTARTESFKKEHHFPLICAIIEMVEIIAEESS